MKSLKTLILSSVIMVCGMNAFAKYENNLVYNSKEVNGVTTAKTVYKHEGNTLQNYMQYNYKYDDQQRKIETDAMKWNAKTSSWENDMRICYSYQGKSTTTTYYKWNKKKQDYVLVPEMTITMDNPNM
ncbi:DUF3836 domain-containing protein [Mediterranea massiliensis]|uniref:DUF3836 domain-containing protein n=1 Tax=Mediterranea massiliensis TaxID=1841865 RepID=UPI0025A49D15|nr:DUF3836 domain-containing protein [Mediterranea massiliensis]MDM8338172.1 DUF3836 domain-containing protein [Mediterranea massiliensis]